MGSRSSAGAILDRRAMFDVTLLTGLGGEERFIDSILARYHPRFPEARAFALERRVLLVETTCGIPIDIALAGLSYEARDMVHFLAGARATQVSRGARSPEGVRHTCRK